MTVVLVLAAMLALASHFAAGYWLGVRRTRHQARWLVRPHSTRTLAKHPLPEQSTATVQEAAFGRTNLPNSTSEFR